MFSATEEQDEEIESLYFESYQNQRRLCRLYGSSAKNLKTSQNGKMKNKDGLCSSSSSSSCENLKTLSSPKDTQTLGTSLNNNSSGSKAPVQKFSDRQLNDLDVEIHADNFNISQPWFVGYQNTTSSQGSPLSLAARYGYNGAIKIVKASRRQEDLGVISGQSQVHGNKQMIPQTSKRVDDCQSDQVLMRLAKTNKYGINTKQLDRAIQREHDVWNEIAVNAKNERTTRSKIIKRSNEIKLSKYCPKSVHLKRSCVKSHKVFSMG